MSILDKLQSLIKIDVSSLKEIKISILSNNNKFENKGNILILNPDGLNEKESQLVRDLIKGNVEEGQVLLEEESDKLFKEVKTIQKTGVNNDLLDFFRGKIPSVDLEILRGAFIIKELHEKHQQVGQLKLDITQRYGKRGSNIANLCTAGYFSKVIKPLYESMASDPDFTIEKFHERYNVIVEQYTFAVFVSSRMTKGQTKEKILNKIKLNKRYGIKQLNVHGLGRDNTIKIQDVLEEIKKDINWPAQIVSDSTYIIAKLSF